MIRMLMPAMPIRHILLVTVWTLVAAVPAGLAADEAAPTESSIESYKDTVKIRYMPSRGRFYKKEPVTELVAETSTIVAKHDGSVMGTNDRIKALFERARELEKRGIDSNQRHFHVAFTTLEITYRGETVKLEYAGPSGDEKYAAYEETWHALYADAYHFLTLRLQPGAGESQE